MLDVRRDVNEVIISGLLNKEVPWRGDYGFPCDVTGARFTGINPLLLNLATRRNGWKTPYWDTADQWGVNGFCLKSRPDCFRTEEWSQEVFLQGWKEFVFNLSQVENDATKFDLTPRFDIAEKIVVATKAKIDFKYNEECAYYHYDEDLILFPLREQFVNGPGGLSGYYHSLFHELMHWTEARVGWEGEFDCEYEKELRAEIGADYICTELLIPRFPYSARKNHISRLGRWVELMRRHPRMIFNLTDDARKGVDYIFAKAGGWSV